MTRRPLVTFFALALVLTWVVWVPRAFASHGVIRGGAAEVVTALASAWTWMPAIAALLTAALAGGRPAVRAWLCRLGRWRVGVRWYAVALLAPAGFWLAAWAAGSFLGLGDMRPRAVDLGATAAGLFAVLLLTDGLGEEAGWRGYALPALLARHRPLVASLGLGLFWAFWHLPLLFTEGSAMDGSPALFHLLDLPATAVLYTWLFVRSQGSALPAFVLHASINLWTPEAIPTGTAAQLALVLGLKWTLVVAALATGLTPPAPMTSGRPSGDLPLSQAPPQRRTRSAEHYPQPT
jgi:membrane protease YdiL (CAAX protease family)